MHVAAAADGRVQVVKVDGRQALLRETVAQAAAQTPWTLTAFCLRVVQRYLHTHTHTHRVHINVTIKAIIQGQKFEAMNHINSFKGSDSPFYCSSLPILLLSLILSICQFISSLK